MTRSVVLVSGGLDSATALAIARARGDECHTLSFDYGQRHRSELAAARRISASLHAAAHREMQVSLDVFGGSALTDKSIAVPEQASAGIPVTYVPARNTVFLSLAMALAEVIDAAKIVIGVNFVDSSGYPDCRPEFIAAFQQLARLATKRGVEGGALTIDAPLITMSKAAIIRYGGGPRRRLHADSVVLSADDQGRACGRCDSCRLRREGFAAAGVPDPTRYR
jgi:7-cyano-7-deazaguanine synthase